MGGTHTVYCNLLVVWFRWELTFRYLAEVLFVNIRFVKLTLFESAVWVTEKCLIFWRKKTRILTKYKVDCVKEFKKKKKNDVWKNLEKLKFENFEN